LKQLENITIQGSPASTNDVEFTARPKGLRHLHLTPIRTVSVKKPYKASAVISTRNKEESVLIF